MFQPGLKLGHVPVGYQTQLGVVHSHTHFRLPTLIGLIPAEGLGVEGGRELGREGVRRGREGGRGGGREGGRDGGRE